MDSRYTNRTNKDSSRARSGMRKNRLEATWLAGQNRRERPVTHRPPPVLVRSSDSARGSMASVPRVEKSRSKKVRRRFDVAINSSGAELRLPSLPVFKASTRLISFALMLVLSILIYHLWNSPLYRSQGAEVRGLKRLKASDVNAVLNLSKAPIFILSPRAMERDLLSAFPEFSAVAVSISLPRTVKVVVVERVPVMTWRQGDRTELVDAEGYTFPLRIEATALITPVVEAYGDPPGLIPVDTQASLTSMTQVNEVEQAANQMIFGDGAKQQPVYARQLLTPDMVTAIRATAGLVPANAPLIYEPRHGLGWRDERGWQVFLGDARDVEIKINVYEAIIQQLAAAGLQPVLVSVEHVHNPYYRLEP